MKFDWFVQTTYSLSLPVLLGYIVWLLKEQRKTRNATAEGTLCLLRVKLIEYHDKYMEKGEIPAYALDNWVRMHKAYKNLNGNGMIDGMNEEIEKLPIK